MAYSLPDKIKRKLIELGVSEPIVVESWMVLVGSGKRYKLPLYITNESLKQLAEEIKADG